MVHRVDDALNERRWWFWFDHRDYTLWLDRFCSYTRPSTRHKHRIHKHYDRTDGRENTISADDTEIPDDVADEAKAFIVASLSVKKCP